MKSLTHVLRLLKFSNLLIKWSLWLLWLLWLLLLLLFAGHPPGGTTQYHNSFEYLLSSGHIELVWPRVAPVRPWQWDQINSPTFLIISSFFFPENVGIDIDFVKYIPNWALAKGKSLNSEPRLRIVLDQRTIKSDG